MCIVSITLSAVISEPVTILWGKIGLFHRWKPSISVYYWRLYGACDIYHMCHFKIAKAIFLNIPVPQNEMLIMNKKDPRVETTADHDKRVNESEVTSKNNSYHE